jgi:hypothetical protein
MTALPMLQISPVIILSKGKDMPPKFKKGDLVFRQALRDKRIGIVEEVGPIEVSQWYTRYIAKVRWENGRSSRLKEHNLKSYKELRKNLRDMMFLEEKVRNEGHRIQSSMKEKGLLTKEANFEAEE